MKILPFKDSQDLSMGVELEYQIINPKSFNLSPEAKDLIRIVRGNPAYNDIVKPEITQSMLEINSSIHFSTKTLRKELYAIRAFLIEQARKVDVLFCGGGTHPFQKWIYRKIFPIPRYKKLSRKYKYLSKRSTVFGMHVHLGCSSAKKAMYLTHIMTRFVPQLIAMSASSPFYQRVDTGFYSTRTTIFNSFPSSGPIPYLTDWQSFSRYFYKMKKLGIAESMKDFYWDVRPKPEFGTVEVRVCDTPLTLEKAVMLAAYIQTLSCYILQERPLRVIPDLYTFCSYNRFQAARYGLEGLIVNPYTLKKYQIKEDILETIELMRSFAIQLGNLQYIVKLRKDIKRNKSDAGMLREILEKKGNLKDVVQEQCRLWKI